MRTVLIAAALLPLVAGGCVRTIATVATAPVKVVSKGVDLTTTSSAEADRNYAHKMRKQQEREAREERRAMQKCRDGSEDCSYRGATR